MSRKHRNHPRPNPDEIRKPPRPITTADDIGSYLFLSPGCHAEGNLLDFLQMNIAVADVSSTFDNRYVYFRV